MSHLQQFIEEHTSVVEPLVKETSLAYWALATTGDPEQEKRLQELDTKLRKVYASAEDYARLKSFSPAQDELLARQHNVLDRAYKANQIPPEMIEKMVALEVKIESMFANFRAEIGGKKYSDNELKAILKNSNDSAERKAAWEASKQIGEQAEQSTLEVVSLRNEAAKIVGFDNYYTMRLELQELDEKRLFEILADLETLTNPYWEKFKGDLDTKYAARFGVNVSDLRPWHYEDPFFQEAPVGEVDLDQYYKGQDIVEISRKFYRTIGMPVDSILERSDLFEREKKNQHAFCTSIDKKEDVRILCNIRDNEQWMGTQLHELGHAVYDLYLDQSLPYLLREPAHILTTEAIAMFFGRLSKNGAFLHTYLGVDEATAKQLDTDCKRQNAAGLLVFARWVLVMTHFERAMYQEPGKDLRAFWWDCVERFQKVTRPENRHAPDWAAKIHLPCAPVYYQNYILGEINASQLVHYVNQFISAASAANDGAGESALNLALVTSPQVGSYLRERLFKLGARYPWEETLRRVTGEGLNVAYFAKDLEALRN